MPRGVLARLPRPVLRLRSAGASRCIGQVGTPERVNRHAPAPPRNLASGTSKIRSRFRLVADSALEGNGFEPSVPRRARTADSATLV
jgi:hypothetical protein